ncbi:rCG28063 [Rattus norvegicus]|uniref:RCG28063 n=1 Tax=Rattus norvegicus TaxID=10116 RepID=A6IEE9_RAT|nr:rCG28063 [Rattus norvegicus]
MVNFKSHHFPPKVAVANFLVSTASPTSKITRVDLPI